MAGRAEAPTLDPPPVPAAPIRLGVSACLLGQPVRYDAGDKRESFIADVLPRYFELVPVCPEVAIGLGVPREPIRLEGAPEAPRAVGVATRTLDVTEPLRAYGRATATRLADLSGYILKSKSPSCGLERVKLYAADGRMRRAATGLFAAELRRALPLMPMVEETALAAPDGRAHFLERVYAYRRWQELLAGGVTLERLADFHAAHKLILLAHDRTRLTALGRLVAQAGGRPPEAVAREYGVVFSEALARPATRRRHADVLYHLAGYLKRVLDGSDKQELAETIEAFRTGALPLLAPVTLLRHHFRRHPHPYVEHQLYLRPPRAGLDPWCAM